MLNKYSTLDLRVKAVSAYFDKKIPLQTIAQTFNIHRVTLFRWIRRYRFGKQAHGLGRLSGSGRPRIVGGECAKRFYRVVLKPASDFGYESDFWTCRRLIQTMESEFNMKVSQPTMWRILRDLELTYQKPEKRYFEANKKKRKAWISETLPQIQRIIKKYRAILYFQDESNISLAPVLARTWAPRGKTPIQEVTGNRGGVAAMSAISGTGSLVFRLHDKRIASQEIIDFLQQILDHHKRRHIVVVMDQAPCHVSKMTMTYINSQKRLHVFHLPPYSPDFNPDEDVWNHLKHQELKSHKAKTKQELRTLANDKLHKMASDKRLLKGLFFRCYVADLLN
jgi:transposase